jgi:hypothetical protein
MKIRSWLIAGLVVGSMAPLLHAQNRITCESRGNRREYCAVEGRGEVTMVRQIGRAECIRGRTWGIDEGGIWVQNGCRAEFQIERRNEGPTWWNQGPGRGRGGMRGAAACFYRERDFRGDYFCMRRGESFPRMPRGFDDQIASIRVFRDSFVEVFQDDDFRGDRARTGRDVRDLRRWRVPENRNRNWGNRISSIRVQ